MFGRVKQWFGIEGIKIKIKALEAYPHKVESINGELEFSSMHRQKVTYTRIKLIERYSRGRGDSKRIDEYLLGEWASDEVFEVDKDSPKTLFFKLPFEFVNSPIDDIGNKGLIRKGLTNLAKTIKGVHSEYRLEAESVVEGTKLNPFDKVVIGFV